MLWLTLKDSGNLIYYLWTADLDKLERNYKKHLGDAPSTSSILKPKKCAIKSA